jgi:hypothetical protein
MYKTLVIIGVLNSPQAMQMEDEKGPYENIMQCYYRGAEMIKTLSDKLPIVHSHTICVDLKELMKEGNKKVKPTTKGLGA